MAMREWICGHYGSIRYGTWITNKVSTESNTSHFVLLESQGEECTSAHLRSVPFPLVLELLQNNAAAPPGSALIDISDWKSEKSRFSRTWRAMPDHARWAFMA